MIINSDERNWSWMDEGLNTFVQFLTEQEFDNNYPSNRGPAHKIVDYMKLPKNQLEPIMTNSENIHNFGANAYAKPATALNILRETVMGRELFDYAFKEYCRRWAFKHPAPADFFRTMEDASGVDLDWYWRGWFYDINPVDISLDSVLCFVVDAPNKPLVKEVKERVGGKRAAEKEFIHVSRQRNLASGMQFLVNQDTSLRDFYYYYKESDEPVDTAQPKMVNRYENITALSESEMEKYKNKYYYELHFSNVGGLVMPLIIQWNYEDGSTEVDRISAYIWRKNESKVIKTFEKNKAVKSIQVDPFKETADIDESNNKWPATLEPTRFELYKTKVLQRGQFDDENKMKKAKK
jgi:hypothetical protein